MLHRRRPDQRAGRAVKHWFDAGLPSPTPPCCASTATRIGLDAALHRRPDQRTVPCRQPDPAIAVTPAAILTDIEGTTTPVAFVTGTRCSPTPARGSPALWPRKAQDAADVAAAMAAGPPLRSRPGNRSLDGIARLDGCRCQGDAAEDAAGADLAPKATPPARCTARFYDGCGSSAAATGTQRGIGLARLFVRLRVAAQRLLFGHSDSQGDLSAAVQWLSSIRATGGKREPGELPHASPPHWACRPEQILFLSDVAEELDAANAAGLQACQLVRAEDATCASPRHAQAANFSAVSDRYG